MVDLLNRFLRWVPKWAVYALYLLPVPLLLYSALTGGMGVDPVKALEHELGEIALQLLIIGLCITPLRRFFRINAIRLRRVFGVLAFIYVSLHLAVWVFLDMQLFLAQMWSDILKRPYITIGMASFVLMIPLAVTSNDSALRRLGAAAWQRVHRLTYPIVLLGAVHNIMVQKVWETEALIYFSVIVVLLAFRVPRFPLRNRKTSPKVG